MRVYKAAIIGCGRIGCEYDYDPTSKIILSHAGAYSKNPRIRLVAVCDLDINKAKKAQKKWGIESVYSDYKQMLVKEKLEIISICTWESTHAEIVEHCVKIKPLAIFCEKPIASTIKDAKKIIRLCDKNGIVLQIDYMRRFSKAYAEIRDYIADGKLGKIQKIVGHYGDGLLTNGSHLVDLANFFTQEKFEKIVSIKSKIKSAYKHDPNYSVLAQTKSGTVFALLPNDNSKYLYMELEIFGENGRILLKKSGYEMSYEKVSNHHSLFHEFKGLEEVPPPFKSKLDGEYMRDGVEELLNCLETGRKSLCSGEDALQTLEFITKCRK